MTKYLNLVRYTVNLRIISAAFNSDVDPRTCLQSIRRQWDFTSCVRLRASSAKLGPNALAVVLLSSESQRSDQCDAHFGSYNKRRPMQANVRPSSTSKQSVDSRHGLSLLLCLPRIRFRKDWEFGVACLFAHLWCLIMQRRQQWALPNNATVVDTKFWHC